MKHKRVLVLFSLVLVTVGVGFFHGGRWSKLSAQDRGNTEIAVTPEDAKDYLETLIISGNPATAARIFERMPPSLLLQVLDLLLKEENTISPQTKAEFLFAAASLHLQNKQLLNRFFTLLKKYQEQTNIVPLLIAVRSPFPKVIKPLAQWAKEQKLFQSWLDSSAQKAVEQDDLGALQQLYIEEVRPDIVLATQLLEQVIDQEKNPYFIPFLVKNLNANVDASKDNKTILMRAVEKDNYDLVDALLKSGANPTIMLDPAVGTASQIAFDRSNELPVVQVKIQELIDDYALTYQQPKRRKRS